MFDVFDIDSNYFTLFTLFSRTFNILLLYLSRVNIFAFQVFAILNFLSPIDFGVFFSCVKLLPQLFHFQILRSLNSSRSQCKYFYLQIRAFFLISATVADCLIASPQNISILSTQGSLNLQSSQIVGSLNLEFLNPWIYYIWKQLSVQKTEGRRTK